MEARIHNPGGKIGGVRHPVYDHNMLHDDDRPQLWAFLTDDELETIAPEYIRGAEMGNESSAYSSLPRSTSSSRKPSGGESRRLLTGREPRLVQPENPCDRAAAREENWSRNLNFCLPKHSGVLLSGPARFHSKLRCVRCPSFVMMRFCSRR